MGAFRAVRGLPSVTLSTAPATVTSSVDWEVDDAVFVCIAVTNTTTDPGVVVRVAMTSSSGSTFFPLMNTNALSSAQTPYHATTSGAILVPGGYKLMQVAATGLITTAGGLAVSANVQMSV